MADKMKVLVTGAAGLVGGHLRTHWGDRYRLRLADIQPVEDLAAHEEFMEMDITDYDAFLAACQGVDAVVHLAADPSMAAEFYRTLLPLNIIGCYNGFEAAREAGCKRIVFASSINAILGYGREGGPVRWDAPVYPVNVYGATKCFGEALGRVYAHQHGLSCIMVRIGGAAWQQGPDGIRSVPKPESPPATRPNSSPVVWRHRRGSTSRLSTAPPTTRSSGWISKCRANWVTSRRTARRWAEPDGARE